MIIFNWKIALEVEKLLIHTMYNESHSTARGIAMPTSSDVVIKSHKEGLD